MGDHLKVTEEMLDAGVAILTAKWGLVGNPVARKVTREIYEAMQRVKHSGRSD